LERKVCFEANVKQDYLIDMNPIMNSLDSK